ncbi:18003_t:CDS:1, partial [Funneliformis geosporum]
CATDLPEALKADDHCGICSVDDSLDNRFERVLAVTSGLDASCCD